MIKTIIISIKNNSFKNINKDNFINIITSNITYSWITKLIYETSLCIFSFS